MKLSRSLWLPGRTRSATGEPGRPAGRPVGVVRQTSPRLGSGGVRQRARPAPARGGLPSWVPRGPLQFVQDSYFELKRVRWPSREETVRLTSAVIGFSVAVGLFLGALDYIFSKLVELLVR